MHLINNGQKSLNLTEISEHIGPLEENMKATNKIGELEAALKGIVTLKDTYNLNIEDLVRGSQGSTGLNHNDLYLMAGMVCDEHLIRTFSAFTSVFYFSRL